jgi:alkylhydroperoxidase family enzyme
VRWPPSIEARSTNCRARFSGLNDAVSDEQSTTIGACAQDEPGGDVGEIRRRALMHKPAPLIGRHPLELCGCADRASIHLADATRHSPSDDRRRLVGHDVVMGSGETDDTGGRARADVLGARPELATAHERLLTTIWDGSVDPVTLELCRLRMATLLTSAAALDERTPAASEAGLTEERIGRLPRWPTDPSFSTEERACIGFAEQFVIDHQQISDDDVHELTELLGAEGVVTFTSALVVWDNQHRLDNALRVTAARG